MRVYRIEDDQGRGVYHVSLGFLCNRAALMGNESVAGRHPGPDSDEGLAKWWEGPGKRWTKAKDNWQNKERRQYVCGFSDETQMLEWFPREGFRLMIKEEERRLLESWTDRNLHVAVYEVHANRVRRGQFQAMFRKEDGRLVEKIALSHYADI